MLAALLHVFVALKRTWAVCAGFHDQCDADTVPCSCLRFGLAQAQLPVQFSLQLYVRSVASLHSMS